MKNQPAPNSNNSVKKLPIALTSHANKQLIKRQKTGGANNEMNGEMRKDCLKGGGGGWDIIEPSWSHFSLSVLCLWL